MWFAFSVFTCARLHALTCLALRFEQDFSLLLTAVTEQPKQERALSAVRVRFLDPDRETPQQRASVAAELVSRPRIFGSGALLL